MSSSSMNLTNLPSTSATQQKGPNTNSINYLSLRAIAKSLAISGIFFFFFYIVLFDTNHYYYQPSDLLTTFKQKLSNNNSTTHRNPTNISHIVFGIVGSMKTWRFRKAYVESWWRPNVTRGYLFLDRPPTKEFLPWPSSSPSFRVNEKITDFVVHPRFARTILETFREGDEGVRWFVMADDDTLIVVDNLANVLSEYDHTKYFYIGSDSECTKANFDHSFDMAFGGAGYALSYPLAAMVASNLDSCIQRYPYISVSDQILHACLTDLGVSRTQNKGFHQIDILRDISGLLSSHPQTPFLSLHHIDNVDPIFPKKNRLDSINHLMKAAKPDPSRLLQQTICHHRERNWTVSVSWGYSAHIYESVLPRSFLRRPIETFAPWKFTRSPLYMFDTRWPSTNPCLAPHVFFFENTSTTTGFGDDARVVTTYVRASPRGRLPACSSSGNHSADHIDKIRVFSPVKLPLEGGLRDCCDVVHSAADINTTEVRYRTCIMQEITA